MRSIRVLLAEDHESVRQGLRLVLEAERDIEVVGEAANGEDAVDAAIRLEPDVVVLDLSMPVQGGLAAARHIREAVPATAVVALTRHNEDAYVKELMKAGAAGYVLKQSASAELLQAIRTAAAGGVRVDPAVITSDVVRRRAVERPPISDREASVLRLMAVGYSNKEIAERLSISVRTVEVHKTNAMRKLSLGGRIDVIRYAAAHDWLIDP